MLDPGYIDSLGKGGRRGGGGLVSVGGLGMESVCQ